MTRSPSRPHTGGRSTAKEDARGHRHPAHRHSRSRRGPPRGLAPGGQPLPGAASPLLPGRRRGRRPRPSGGCSPSWGSCTKPSSTGRSAAGSTPGWSPPGGRRRRPLAGADPPAGERAVEPVRSGWFDHTSTEWPQRRTEFSAGVTRLREVDLGSLDDQGLAGQFGQVMEFSLGAFDVHFMLQCLNGIMLTDLAFTCRDLLGWDEPRPSSCSADCRRRRPGRPAPWPGWPRWRGNGRPSAAS